MTAKIVEYMIERSTFTLSIIISTDETIIVPSMNPKNSIIGTKNKMAATTATMFFIPSKVNLSSNAIDESFGIIFFLIMTTLLMI